MYNTYIKRKPMPQRFEKKNNTSISIKMDLGLFNIGGAGGRWT